VAAGLTLDSGALIAAEKNALTFWAIWKRAIQRQTRVTLPAVVLAQAWRGNSPVIARLLPGCKIEPMDEESAKRTGELLAKSRTADVIDAAVVLGAVARGDGILTSDPHDIGRLVAATGSKIRVVPV
jgi:predicted nucleic acid-binding protein